ncbi:hypothetical protein NXV13_11310 [Bacteroides ovatus]|nr:hypothetical protein [Bacteroides ovatus]
MLLTTNPTINWVRSRFVQDENGDKVICREGEAYIPFSVFDNPNIAFRQVYEALPEQDPGPGDKGTPALWQLGFRGSQRYGDL